MSVSAVSIREVAKTFDSFTALADVSLDIADNEFFTLLGPSGCGKTTLLRLIAGFETTTRGEIALYGEPIASLPPDRRSVNTVFQNYALFPHMTVTGNIAFGLRMLGWSAAQVDERVSQMISMVRLEEFAQRWPSQLSGGQQQRVALARAMAPRPKVLLLDEPLSALDLKLRQEMRAELKQIQHETGITFIFVTHDQEEALTMSDRIAVMSAGKVQQVGTAHEIYEEPANRFVANFIGETNLLAATLEQVQGEQGLCRTDNGKTLGVRVPADVPVGATGWVSIRPERIALEGCGDALTGVLRDLTYLGTDTQYTVRLDTGADLIVRAQNNAQATPQAVGSSVALHVEAGAARFLAD